MWAVNTCALFPFISFFAVIMMVECAPLPQDKIPSKEMESFMKQYGYIGSGPDNADALYTEEGFKMAVEQMQKFGGLPQTGVLDEATINLTRSPRCGVPDVISHHRSKRYILGPTAWKKRNLTYFLANWSPQLQQAVTKSKLAKAFGLWADVTPLRFTPRESMDADLIVAFGRGYHGDLYPFDGPSGVLAHAYFPYEHGSYGGDVHFDDDENWIDASTTESEEGVDFYTVAAHEIGHSLGLAHSTVRGSIMFPYYKGYDAYMRLDYDDVYAMYSMYVLNAKYEDEDTITTEHEEPHYPDRDDDEVTPPKDDDYDDDNGEEESTEKTHDDDNDNDEEESVDKVDGDDETDDSHDYDHDEDSDYQPKSVTPTEGGFNDEGTNTEGEDSNKDWEDDAVYTEFFDWSTVVSGEVDGATSSTEKKPETSTTPATTTMTPQVTTPKIPSLCDGSMDAASLFRDELFIFKGRFMWRLRDRNERVPGYPVDFHIFFTGIPRSIQSIDAVYQRPFDYNILFFTGNQYWIFDGNRFSNDSPRPLTDLGLPSDLDKLDAAFVWAKNGRTYFFRKDQYWRYDDRNRKMENGYPQRITRWRGLVPDIDTAFTWRDSKTYFFKDHYFWQFNNQNVTIENNYPQNIASYWFGCNQ